MRRLSKLVLQEECVTRLLDEGHMVDLVYVDFAKAFASVNHRFLLAQLKSPGIHGAALSWIETHLSSYQAQMDGVLFEEAPALVAPHKVQSLDHYFFCYI